MAASDDRSYEITERSVSANGMVFETLECGGGDRLVLCLHGFPSHAMCWRDQLPALARLGYRAWAPNLRGYGNSSRPVRVADYAIGPLLEDIAGIIDASGARSVVLIAHDWGGLLAWFFAARRIRALDGLVILNAPHPACAAVAFRRWRQMRKGWYILAFQIPWLPDWLLGLNRAWLISRLIAGVAGKPTVFSAEMLDFYRRKAAERGAITAMLNWYRGMVRGGVPHEMTGDFPVIDTPTMVIWGDGDIVLDFACIDGAEKFLSDVTIHRLPGVSHWVQEEEPKVVNGLIAGFLSSRCKLV